MKNKELREKNINELVKDLEEKRSLAQSSMFDIFVKQAKDNKVLRNTKKEIARILTIIREKNNI